ncbi:MAG: hypothetical protein M0Q91_15150 [Methanoregula sp.]|nr:hypothetical protein [Methanoregula sp.]
MAHINPGMDTTINPIIINDSFRSKPIKAKFDHRCWITGENNCDGKCDSIQPASCFGSYECKTCQCTSCNQAGGVK